MGRKAYTYNQVKEIISERGSRLISTNYINAHEPLDIECSCGERIIQPLYTFLRKKRGCKHCMVNRKKTYDEIKFIVEKNGCELLSKKYDPNSKMRLRCECGDKFSVGFGNFYRRKITRCRKCLKKESSAERVIREYLTKNKIKFEREFQFPDCRNKKPLMFDFAVLDKDENVEFLIEYNGAQHYNEITSFGDKRYYDYITKNDEIKKEYCTKEGIDLLVIPYWEKSNIDKILSHRVGGF